MGAALAAAPAEHVLLSVRAIVRLTLFAWLPWLPRRIRSGFASIGLLTCSILLAYFSGDYIEVYSHFFVIVAVLAVYKDWPPFIVGVPYIAVQHGVLGMNHPEAVYDHPDTIANPMGWRLVHAVFILMLVSTLVTNWFPIERSREEIKQKMQGLEGSEEAKTEVERLNEQLVVQADELTVAVDAVSEGDFTVDPSERSDIGAIEAVSDMFITMKYDLSSTIVSLRTFAATAE